MNKLPLFLLILFSYFLLIMQFTFSQEDNIKITISRFAPSLSLSIPQGTSKRLDFFIENTYNESVIIFYRIEKPSGVEIEAYPPKYYSLGPNVEIAGYLNISVDPYLENRSFTIKFWIDSFTEFANSTIRSNKFSINLNVLSNPSVFNTTTTTTTIATETTSGEAPIETLTTALTTEIPTIVPPTVENYEIAYKEYVIVLVVIIVLLLIPLLMFRKSLTKGNSSTSSQEGIQAWHLQFYRPIFHSS